MVVSKHQGHVSKPPPRPPDETDHVMLRRQLRQAGRGNVDPWADVGHWPRLCEKSARYDLDAEPLPKGRVRRGRRASPGQFIKVPKNGKPVGPISTISQNSLPTHLTAPAGMTMRTSRSSEARKSAASNHGST
jgi:hypothetical protein